MQGEYNSLDKVSTFFHIVYTELFYFSVSHVFSNIKTGVDVAEFKTVVWNVTRRRGARDERQVSDAIEFLYTWWVNPDNSTARRKMLIDVSLLYNSKLRG